MSDDAQPVESSRSDRDDELVVEPDDSLDADGLGQDVELDMIDAELALREAGGEADRAEEIIETQRQAHDERYIVPTDERPV